MKQVNHSFMGQFQAARQEVAQLRTLMGDSAKLATLTFPQRNTATEPNQRVAGNQKKKR